MAPTLVIAGYYGFGNWGDEAALAVLIHHLRRTLPQARLVVLSNDPPQTVQLHNTDAINRWNLLEIRRALTRASGFVLGPGGLLQDTTSTRSLLYYLGLLRWAQRYKLPTYLIGQGIGPLRSQHSERWVAQTMRRARLVLVRDRVSYEWALAHGVRAVLGEDLAMLYSSPPHRRGDGSGVRVGISLRPGLSPSNFTVLRRALQAFAAKDCEIVFLPFQADQDLAVLKELGFSIPVVEAHRPSDLLEAMCSLDMVLGMRLHSLVFALIAGVPFCALSYDPKIEGFLHRVADVCAYPILWWSASERLSESALVQQILELYAQRSDLRGRLHQGRTILQAAAQRAFDEALRVIVSDLVVTF
jgi:polysaccharide pyruvyl transferase CsaB